LLPQGAFTYTNFATCIIFFKKGGNTKECKIYEAKFMKPKDTSSEIYVEDVPIKVFSLKELQDNNYSLSLVEEKEEQLKMGWVKLEDVLEFGKKSSHKAGDSDDNEKYPFYTSSRIIKKSKYCDYTKMSLIIGTGGNANIHMDKNFSCSADNFTLTIKNNDDITYMYYYLKLNMQIIENGFHGGGIKHLNKDYLCSIQIPSLSLEHQTEIVEFLDKQFEQYNINLLTDKLKDINLFDLLITKQYDTCTDALHLIYRKIETDALVKSMDRDKKAIFNMLLNGCDYETVKLGDLVEFDKGNFNTKDVDNSGKYPYYNSGCNNPSGSHSEFTIDKPEYILFVKDGGDKNNPLNENSGMAKPFYVTGKSAVNGCILIFLNNNAEQLNLKFLYYYLNFNRAINMRKVKYNSGIGHLGKSDIVISQIKLPSLEDQTNIIKKIDDIEKEQSTYKQYGDMLQGLLDNMQNVIGKIINETLNNDINEQSDKHEDTENNDDIDDIVDTEIAVKSKNTVSKKPKKKAMSIKKVELEEINEPVQLEEINEPVQLEEINEPVQLENKPKKPKKKEIVKPIVEDIQEEEIEIEEYEWDVSVLNKMKKIKDDKPKLVKLRKENNISKDIFYAKINEIHQTGAQKTK
jgi:restriction endonuclease S subunit